MTIEILHTDADGDRLFSDSHPTTLGVFSDNGEVYVPESAVEALKAELKNPGHFGELEAAARKLRALQAAGVDNWDGYGEAMASLREED
jgi:hypothetical protein